MQVKISDSIKYIGVEDKTIDLLKVSILFPTEFLTTHILLLTKRLQLWIRLTKRKLTNGLKILTESLTAELPDYLVISHLEPDHASNIKVVSRNIRQ